MTNHAAAIPNPALQPLSVLVGTWHTAIRHRLLPGMTFHGSTMFEWMEGGAFLRMFAEVDHPDFPVGLAVISRDDEHNGYVMFQFDSRGESRIYQMSLEGNVWTTWRDAPAFSQRTVGTVSADGQTIDCVGELSEDDATWLGDIEITYTRVNGNGDNADGDE
jgi:hypothetical protein